jgi:hypothetical protein
MPLAPTPIELTLRVRNANVIVVPGITNALTGAYDNALDLSMALHEYDAEDETTLGTVIANSAADLTVTTNGTYKGTIPQNAAIEHGTDYWLVIIESGLLTDYWIHCIAKNRGAAL